ncbi:3-hydroxyacyl-CoA dehydrogenase family protein [Allokutzneria albata]|uniref:3-hydroxybutyryl-CoA dehydrogenase n=1 Tax=Allokutzneria albata TaxID=211114 RepID=A0A1G9UZM7_ALLAB|nr:3-hydroxyacyl-CoA dehydrogenase family protein [Allokutzneria albata]SDM65236.1 3-hydroxybutyryl-CoA dehydrogenase [Allokutzneria albata]
MNGARPVGVIGAGTMGAGVAQCLAEAGREVIVVDPVPGALTSGLDRLREGLRLTKQLRRLPSTPPPDALALVRWTTEITELGAACFVIECAPERLALKDKIFAELDVVCRPDAVLASCTSTVPVERLAANTRRPDRVLATHFMNPAPLKRSVEVVRGALTSDNTVDRTLALLTDLGKQGIVVREFVSTRVVLLAVNEAAHAVQAQSADPSTVDKVFQDCLGHAMGPLATADLIGLDTVLDSLVVLQEYTNDPRFAPSRLLADLVCAGHLGRKTGRGFHTYPSR